MKWTDFFLCSGVFYALYYGVNILIDVGKGVRLGTEPGTDEVLHFTEYTAPVSVSEVPIVLPANEKEVQTVQKDAPAVVNKQPTATNQAPVENAIEGRGVTIKDFWDLAQKEAVEFTNKVSFAQ